MNRQREASWKASPGRASGTNLGRLIACACLGAALCLTHGCEEKRIPERQASFRLRVDKVLYVENSSRVIVVGFVTHGSVKPGAHLTLRHGAASIPVTVERLEHPERRMTVAREGDQVGLILHGAGKDQAQAGDVVESR